MNGYVRKHVYFCIELNGIGTCTQISKAVEAEVARRLAEKEKEREEQEAEARKQAEEANASTNASADGSAAIPTGMLTPILKRHQDLDDELNRRLRELEEK